MQGHQHAGRRAPDVVALPGHGPVFAQGAAHLDAVALVVGLSRRNSSGGSNTSATSKSSSFRFSGGVTRPTTGVMTKPVPVRYSGRRPRISICDAGDADFFLGFAQGGGLGRSVARLAAAAGKAHLPGMVAQMRGALGQQHGQPALAHDHRHQHGGRRQILALGRHHDSITGGATAPSLNRRRIRDSKPPLEFGLALTKDSGMKPIAIFRHSPGEGPGYFATFLDRHSLPWTLFTDRCRRARHRRLPTIFRACASWAGR